MRASLCGQESRKKPLRTWECATAGDPRSGWIIHLEKYYSCVSLETDHVQARRSSRLTVTDGKDASGEESWVNDQADEQSLKYFCGGGSPWTKDACSADQGGG